MQTETQTSTQTDADADADVDAGRQAGRQTQTHMYTYTHTHVHAYTQTHIGPRVQLASSPLLTSVAAPLGSSGMTPDVLPAKWAAETLDHDTAFRLLFVVPVATRTHHTHYGFQGCHLALAPHWATGLRFLCLDRYAFIPTCK